MSDHQPARIAASISFAEDRELLLAFARSGNEAAFTEIVRRHAGLVRAVSRRVTGDPDMAEETAQSVFTLLARRAAAAAKSGHVAGWLHRAAVFDALRRVRAETRRRRTLAAFAEDMKTSSPAPDAPPPDPAWREALPLLDACLQSLRETDRRALLMRWFENRGYAEIGAALGKSEEAAKKQVNRALDRLRLRMGKRGASLSGASLAAVLSAAQTPAPASAAVTLTVSSLTKAAIAAAPGLSWKTLLIHSLHFMNGLKTPAAVSAILLLCAVPVLRQERVIAAVRQEITSLERRAATLPPLTAAASSPVLSKPEPPFVPAEAPVVMDIEQVAKDAEAANTMGIVTPSRQAAKDRIAALDAETVSKLMEDIPKLSGGRKRQETVRGFLFTDLSEKDRTRAARLVPFMMKNTGTDGMMHLHGSIIQLFSGWLKEDPDTALREYRALLDSGGFQGKGTESYQSQITGVFTGQLFETRPAEARELYKGLDEAARINALLNMARIAPEEDRDFILTETAKMEPRHQTNVYQSLITREIDRSGLDAAGALLRELSLPPEQSKEVAVNLVGGVNSTQAGRDLTIAQRLEWLRTQVPADQFARAAGESMSRTMDFGVGNIEENRIKTFREYDWGTGRDEAIAGLFSDEWRVSPGKAELKVSLAEEITDPALRLETLRRLERKFRVNPVPFKTAVEASAVLTPEEKTQIFQQP